MTATQTESLVSRIVEKNVQFLINEFSIDLETAFDFVYSSKTFASLNRDNSGLRARSADYIYELVRNEFMAQKDTENP